MTPVTLWFWCPPEEKTQKSKSTTNLSIDALRGHARSADAVAGAVDTRSLHSAAAQWKLLQPLDVSCIAAFYKGEGTIIYLISLWLWSSWRRFYSAPNILRIWNEMLKVKNNLEIVLITDLLWSICQAFVSSCLGVFFSIFLIVNEILNGFE